MERASSRMVGRRDEDSAEAMIDVKYRQSAAEREVVFVLQRLYLCASVEFLITVADFFLQALPQTPNTATSDRLPLKQTAKPRADTNTASPVRTRLRAVVLDPEVVFVASLMKADAPALVASFQCDFSLQLEEDGRQDMRANLRELRVLACPFIRDQEDAAVTTVLRPCSVALETKTVPNQPLSGCVTVEEVVLKISPFILNTVMTITAAMTARRRVDDDGAAPLEVGDLWSVRNIYGCNFWFLGVDSASEATESLRDLDQGRQGESFSAEVKVVQSSFSGSAKNWSSLLQLRADMTLEVNYFNEIHAVWEPLIERVDGGRRRWTLELEMKNNPRCRTGVGPRRRFRHPARTSPGRQCFLQRHPERHGVPEQPERPTEPGQGVLRGRLLLLRPSLKEKAPSPQELLGIPLMVQHSPSLRPRGPPGQGKLQELPVDQSLDLELSMIRTSSRGKLSALQRQESSLFSLSIVPSGFSEISNIAVDKPGRRLYNVRGPSLQEAVSVLLQIDAADGNKVITVRSPLQIRNHFSVPFTVLKFCPASRSLKSNSCSVVPPTRCQLFVAPAGPLSSQYGPSSSCVCWKEQIHRSFEVSSLLQCPSLDGSLPLMVVAVALPDDLQHISSRGEEDWDPAYILHLHPGATLRNLLPFRVRYMMENSADSYELPAGSTADLLNARVSGEILSLVLMRYQGRDWHGHIRILQEVPEFFSVVLACDSDSSMTVDLSVHVSRISGRLLLALFSPYWIINKTSRVLQYRAENLTVKHPAEHQDIVLFSFRKKNFFSKSKLQLSVSTSSWSEAFSPDAVGSYGCVRCPASNMDFLVGVSIQMSSTNLTRIVTMSPFFTLLNKSSYELEVGELCSPTATRWHYIASSECLPLWPENPSGKLCLRVVGSESSSNFFFFNRQDSGILLRLDQCGGIIVDVNMTDHSTIISFNEYYEGAAPALLLNHTPWVSIRYKQSGSAGVQDLNPGEARLFVWDDPSGERSLSWSCMENHGDLDLLKDDVGQFSYDIRSQVHWVSFLDGRQRVLLFTEDVAVGDEGSAGGGAGAVRTGSEGVVWEMKPKSRWKPFSQKNINLLEEAFQKQRGGGGGWVTLETHLEVNLGGATMMMRKPISCQVRRNFLSGIQVEFKQSQHQRCLRAQLHWLQVDNQLPGAIFPIVFHPVPPPKSIALDSEPKPFIELSVIMRFNRHSNVMQIKYFMALVQEMAVKIDQGFLSAIVALFTPAAELHAERQKAGLLDKDLKKLQTELMETSLSDQSTLSFFQHFHISPIKLHLSLSMGSSGSEESLEMIYNNCICYMLQLHLSLSMGSSGSEESPEAMQSLNLLLQSIGATLTDVDDIVFKLAFFEVKYQFYRREKLMWAVVRHYSEQFLKQMYVLVLGLDVLGNPFGLIRGLSEGVEAFFYEPFQGAVQGPEEFAEGFAIGVRTLLGNTVGGAAGVVSRITGSVGKGLAAITMDKEFQQKRREEMNRPPRDFGESLAKGGKGLLKGVLGGVTGIVTKPVEGARKEGAAGFFKGIGKGLVGVVARPTGGIVDMASSTFHGIQRAAESTEEVSRLRPVRLIQEDGIIRPYDLTEAQGFDLFQVTTSTTL
ncbi:Vacuolar protein sorting-associated protein 13C [Dissostichus eleginoides]|uniref:Vacuolar protein sorting-associated protein 13C n=1 Tax=Dissostichus eleginoides TaxID=100907 RepID=A0AAD9B3D1_DISEL|nr:Vacuolar protein sorting-associated protein 13C [Dissostichus eleginoides]